MFIGQSKMCQSKMGSRHKQKLKKALQHPVPAMDGILLCMSSSFMLIPGLLPFLLPMSRYAYYFTVVASVTVFCSINYWKSSQQTGIRKDLDLVVSKTATVIYFFTGFFYLDTTKLSTLRVVGWILFFLLITFYKLSCYLWDQNNSNWVYFHAMFHISGALAQTLVVIGAFAPDRCAAMLNTLTAITEKIITIIFG